MFKSAGDLRRETDALRRLTHLGIALRLHALRQGHYPQDLTTLKLPADELGDPWGKGPLRWDAATRRLWSVGRDGTDDGGKRGKDQVLSLPSLDD
jgi:hypothetical protein